MCEEGGADCLCRLPHRFSLRLYLDPLSSSPSPPFADRRTSRRGRHLPAPASLRIACLSPRPKMPIGRSFLQVVVVLTALILLLAQVVAAARDFYKILGVDRSASERDIKRAYRKLAQKLHPDKNPDQHEKFIDVSDAYQVLTDADLRKVYDRYGEEGVKKHQNGEDASGRPKDPFDLFASWFSGGGHPGANAVRKGPSKQFNVQVALGDVYMGKAFSIHHDRRVVCPHCDGSGAETKSDIHQCQACGGRGVRIVRQQIMPGFVTNAQMTCDVCGGAGTTIAHKCHVCGGDKVVVEPQVEMEIDLMPGTPEGTVLTVEGEADESPDYEAGDIIIRITSARQAGDFRRQGQHLYYDHAISLADALLGFSHNITHYDGHHVVITRDGVTQPGYTQTIEGEGLPLWNEERQTPQFYLKQENDISKTDYGNLYIRYDVVLPQVVTPDARKRTYGTAKQEKKRIWLSFLLTSSVFTPELEKIFGIKSNHEPTGAHDDL